MIERHLEHTKIVYFGELITINIQEDQQKFISAEGIIDPTVIVCDLKYDENSQKIEEFQKKYHLQQMCNIFRILPFIHQKEQEELKILRQNAESMDINSKQFESITKKIINQKLKVQTENKKNIDIMQEFMGKPLSYDQNIILQHVKSYKYLDIKSDDYFTILKNQFKLAQYPSSSSRFQIKSCYKHMNQVCQYVCQEEDIYLVANNKLFKNWGITIDVITQENRYFDYNNLFMKQEKLQKFQINLYRRFNQKNADRIYYGDYVWIYFPELSEYWTINQKEQNLILKDFHKDNDKYSMGLWIIEHENSHEGSVVLYQTLIKKKIRFGTPVRFKNMILNQYLEVNDVNVRRGMGSSAQIANMNLSYNPYFQKALQQAEQARLCEQKLTLTDKKTEKTIFSIQSIGQNDSIKLTNKNIFQIKNNFYQINVSATYNQNLTFLKQKSEEQDLFQFIQPTAYELWESIYLSQSFRIVQFGSYTVKKFIKSMNKQNFLLDSVDNNQLSLLKQCIHQLVLFCVDADQGKSILDDTTVNANSLLNERKRKLQQAGYITLIARLIHVCFPNEQSLMYIEQINIQQQDGIKVKPIIALIKELYEVTKTCYQLLQIIIKDNKSIQIELFSKINYFFHHFGFIKEADQCLRTCLMQHSELINTMYRMDLNKEYQQIKLQEVQEDEIYSVYHQEIDNMTNTSDNMTNTSDNFQFLQKLIVNNNYQRMQSIQGQNNRNITLLKRQTLKQGNIEKYNLINFMIDRYTHLGQQNIRHSQRIQIYEFLNFICQSEISGLSNIQIQVYELLKDPQYQNIFFNYTLFSLGQQSFDKLDQERQLKIEVIKQYLQLISNLLNGRNYIMMDILRLDFPFTEMVDQIVDNKFDLEDDIQAILIQLLTKLYIDTKPFAETILPSNICNIIQYYKHAMNISNLEIEMSVYKPSKEYKQDSLDEETHFNIIKLSKYFMKQMKPKQNLDIIYNFMKLTRKLISYQFFKIKVAEERDLLFQIMTNMKQYLDSVKDLNNNLIQNIMIEVLRSVSLFLDLSNQQNFKNVVKFFVNANETHSNNNIENLDSYIKQNLKHHMPKCSFLDLFQEKDLEKFILNLIDISKKCNNYKIDLLVYKIIFQRIYQNTFLINHLKQIQTISNNEDYTLYRQIKKITRQLLFECECCEMWVEIPEANMKLEPFKQASMEKFNNLLISLISVFFPENFKYTDPLQHKSSVILFIQIMLRNINVHSIIIHFIWQNYDLFKTIKERNENNDLFIDIFQNSFNFLILFMSNNNTINKQLVIQIEDTLLESFDCYEIGQIEMLSEIYVNNENKMDRQHSVSNDLIQRLIYHIIDKKKQRYHTRYLRFLSIIIQNQHNRINLIHFIHIIIQQKQLVDLLFLNPQILERGQDIFMLDFNNCDPSKQQPYLYHIEILKIFNLLFEENFKQTALIQEEIKQYITFNKIIRFLCRPDIFTCGLFEKEKHQFTLTFALKEQVMRLFINIFSNDLDLQTVVQNSDFELVILYFQIENEKINNLDNIRSMDGEIENIIQQNDEIFQKASLQQFRNSPDYIQNLHQEAINQLYNQLDKSQYCKFQHFYQLVYIFPFFNTIQALNLNQDKENQLLKVQNPYLDSLMELVNDIPGTIYSDYLEILDYVQMIKMQQQNFFRAKEKGQQFLFDLNNYPSQQISKKINIQPPIYNDSLYETIFSDENFNLVRAIVLSIITSDDVKVQYCDPENKLLLKIIKDMESTQQFQNLIYHMMKFVQDTLSDNFNKSDMLQKEIECSKDVCANILKLLQLIIVNADNLGESVHNQKTYSRQIIFDMQNAVIYQEPENDELVALKEDKSIKNISYQQRMQNIYIDKQILNMILNNICLPVIDVKLFYAHIDLCISILEKGNLKAQDEIYKYFTETKQSENLFKRIEYFIKNDIKCLQKSQEISTLIFMSIVKLSSSQNDEDNTIKLLKFVDLLTEDHHSNLQEYVIEQHNLDNSVNLMSIIVDYTEQLIKNLSENNYYKLYQCIETLIEFMQNKNAGQNKKIQNLQTWSQAILIDNIQIILEKYQSIEIDYLQHYQNQKNNQTTFLSTKFLTQISFNQIQQKEDTMEKMNQIIKYKTSSLFQTKGVKSILRNQTILQRDFNNTSSKIMQKRIPLSSETQDLDHYTIDLLIQRIIGDFNNDLTSKLLQNVQQYELEFEPWIIRRLQFKILIFLNTLIEVGIDQKMLKIIHVKIPLKVLAKNLLAIYKQYKVVFNGSYTSSLFENFEQISIKAKLPSEVIIDNGFKIFAMIQHYRQFYTDDFEEDEILQIEWIKNAITENKLLDNYEKQVFFEALKFFQDKTGFVEIIKERRHFVYFPILPYCNQQNSEVIKDKFLYEANRSNQKAKLLDILIKSEEMLTELKYQSQLDEVSIYFLFSMVNKHQTIIRYALFILNLIQNIIILITEKGDHTFKLEIIILKKLQNDTDDQYLYIILLVVESIQILVSFILLLLFTLTRINKAQIQMEVHNKNNQKHVNIIQNVDLLLQNSWLTIKTIVNDGSFYLRLTYFVFSVLGLFNYIFIAILLCEIFFQIKMLQEILLSIWRPRVQIFLLIFIFFLVQYLFAMVAYYGFNDHYITGDDQKESSCNQLIICFSMMFDSTFKIDGGWTGVYNINQKRYKDYVINGKAIFDFVYVFIVLILIVDILGGVIIDTFGELRDESYARQEDQLNFCYICGLHRRDLSKLGKKSDFKEHITKKHNIWNYLYYIAYIENKPYNELSNLESYVLENKQLLSVEWFPISSDQDEFVEFMNEFTEKFSDLQFAQKIEKLDDQIQRILTTQKHI